MKSYKGWFARTLILVVIGIALVSIGVWSYLHKFEANSSPASLGPTKTSLSSTTASQVAVSGNSAVNAQASSSPIVSLAAFFPGIDFSQYAQMTDPSGNLDAQTISVSVNNTNNFITPQGKTYSNLSFPSNFFANQGWTDRVSWGAYLFSADGRGGSCSQLIPWIKIINNTLVFVVDETSAAKCDGGVINPDGSFEHIFISNPYDLSHVNSDMSPIN